MKTCMEWPEATLLAAYPDIYPMVMEQIIEPFSSVEEARAFWDTTGCSLVIIEMADSMSEKQLEEFAHTKRKAKPEHAAKS